MMFICPLVFQILSTKYETRRGLYDRQGKAITNFQLKLPEPQSDLAEQTLKNILH